MNNDNGTGVSHELKVAQQDAKLLLFIGPPKTGTTSIIASLGTKENRTMLRGKNIYFQEIKKSQMTYNQLAKALCEDPALLNITPVSRKASTSILAAEAFWGCINDQSLFRFLTLSKGVFTSIELVFIKRKVEDLAISQFLQSCKILVRSSKEPKTSDSGMNERHRLIEEKVERFLLGESSVIRPYAMNYLALSQCSFPVSYIDYDKSKDIVSDFFAKVLDCKLQDNSMTSMNKTSSGEDPIKAYLSLKIDELLKTSGSTISQERIDLLRDVILILPSNLKLGIRKLGGPKFRSQAAEVERQFRAVSPAFKLLKDRL